MCQYIIMPFSSNFYLFVFGNVIENRMTIKCWPQRTTPRRVILSKAKDLKTQSLTPPYEGGKGDVSLAKEMHKQIQPPSESTFPCLLHKGDSCAMHADSSLRSE